MTADVTAGSVHPPLPTSTQVVVVGAGFAGLTAACQLVQQGLDVVVLEAADRVGGRVMVETSALGSAVDVGGQWIGKGHHRFESLASQLGATRYKMRSPKRPLIVDDDGELAQLSSAMLAANAALIVLELASHLPTPDSRYTTTVQQWLARIPSARARRMLDVVLEVTCCTDSTELSVAGLLKLIRYQGGLATMMKSSGGAQDSLLVEGAGALANRMGKKLADRVVLGSAVTAVAHGTEGLTVTTSTGSVIAERVIVTVPPPSASHIDFGQLLPERRTRVHHNTFMGEVYKAVAVYETPFWRDHADAEIILLGETGFAVFDSSPPDGPGHLTILIGGPDARRVELLGRTERRDLLLGTLASHLGDDIRRPASWHEKFWRHAPFVGGGYASLPTLGTSDGFYPVAHEPVGGIHWAGTETATEHAGYIEGAIESGERAALEVAAALTDPEQRARFPGAR
ncbi:flavin monoamine oxidase family protein [Gordonia otitidis]|uniref:Flavin-containing amine oxidase n=1 Tax=Gordonia otitidis (strain DSM 44809 / CCUG 52243 / JCM 12355 / NBRC 100426 / IFM 10032) TaxID=1108044 RepID=H5TP26_GORO1|nr:FAD-dependent oxidoreductase [Gordonia otitidis]GAB35234.1 putative flavin-containing amine oxidase [Gordonia otitidis NBRC 100426]